MDQNQMMLEYLMQIGAMQPEQDAVGRQRALVDQLRQGGRAPGMRDAGRVVKAAHPLEFLASLGSNAMADKGEQQANQAQDAYSQKRRGALNDLRTRMMPGGAPPPGIDPLTGAPLPAY